MDWYRSKNQNKSESSQSSSTETGGTRFASIAFGVKPQTLPIIKTNKTAN